MIMYEMRVRIVAYPIRQVIEKWSPGFNNSRTCTSAKGPEGGCVDTADRAADSFRFRRLCSHQQRTVITTFETLKICATSVFSDVHDETAAMDYYHLSVRGADLAEGCI